MKLMMKAFAGAFYGFAIVTAAYLAGIVAHYGVLQNGNPAEPHSGTFMFVTVLILFAIGRVFDSTEQ